MVDMVKAEQFYNKMAGGNTIADEHDFRREINKYSEKDGDSYSFNRDEFNQLADDMGLVEQTVKDDIWNNFTHKTYTIINSNGRVDGEKWLPYITVNDIVTAVKNKTQSFWEGFIFADFNEFKVLYTGEKPVNTGMGLRDVANTDRALRDKEEHNDIVFNNYNLIADSNGVLNRDALIKGIKIFTNGKDEMESYEYNRFADAIGIPDYNFDTKINMQRVIWDMLPKTEDRNVKIEDIVRAMENASGQRIGTGVWHNFNEFKAIFPWEI